VRTFDTMRPLYIEKADLERWLAESDICQRIRRQYPRFLEILCKKFDLDIQWVLEYGPTTRPED